jgi:hypothetical protein
MFCLAANDDVSGPLLLQYAKNKLPDLVNEAAK